MTFTCDICSKVIAKKYGKDAKFFLRRHCRRVHKISYNGQEHLKMIKDMENLHIEHEATTNMETSEGGINVQASGNQGPIQ